MRKLLLLSTIAAVSGAGAGIAAAQSIEQVSQTRMSSAPPNVSMDVKRAWIAHALDDFLSGPDDHAGQGASQSPSHRQ